MDNQKGKRNLKNTSKAQGLIAALLALAITTMLLPAGTVFAQGEHTVTYLPNGGTFEKGITKIVHYHDILSPEHDIYPTTRMEIRSAEGELLDIVKLTRPGYRFVGWMDQDRVIWQPDRGILVGCERDWILTAQWEEIVSTTAAAPTATGAPPPTTQVNIKMPDPPRGPVIVLEVMVPVHDNPNTADASNTGLWLPASAFALLGIIVASARKRAKAH
jgi:hypothetical protein